MKNGQVNKKGVQKLLRLLVNFIIAFAVYRLIIELGERVHVMIYYIGVTAYSVAIAVLFCVFYAKNGYTFSNAPIDESLLPADMTAAEKQEYIARHAEKRRSAQNLLYIIAPMVVTVLIDYAMLILSDFFS